MKKSNGVIIFAVVVIVAFWVLIFAVGSDSPDTQGNSQQVGNIVDSSTSTTITTETTTETTTEESTTFPETITEESTTEEETTTEKQETTTKKLTTTKKETTTKKITTTKQETTTKKTSSKYNYVLNTSTKKFHYPSCWTVDKIEPENYDTYYGTRDEVIRQGYDSCGHCDP